MQTLISLQDVWVRYRVNHRGVYSLKDWVTAMLPGAQYRTILEQIDLDIKEGESYGIMGANGSGKSTLLRTLAGIIKPWKGKVWQQASIAPVLALGAGLEPELSGFENIRLLLSLYGHPKQHHSLHWIQEFAELDQATLREPIKCYSSGMIARLSFSISFAGNSQVYLIDEVLAVGDFGFQQRCRDHLKKILAEGKSIIFVSHSPEEVESLCQQAILLQQGLITHRGTAREVCQQYRNLF